jgi:hypothetical protein
MSTDNPIVEPEDKFYSSTETDLEETTEEVKAEVVAEPQDLPKDELETPENSEELAAQDENQESQFIELDGEETNLEDIRKWRDGHLMQADYTKKTTQHAEERKIFKAEQELERENLLKSQAEVSEMKDMLSVLVSEDEAIDWAELKERDLEEYVELKEKADKRKAALEKVKAEKNTPIDDPALIEQERLAFWKENPEWLDKEGKATDVHKADMSLMSDYVAKAGFTPDEFGKMNTSRQLMTILKAAKYDALQEKGHEIREKREKVPVITKPKASENNQPKSAPDIFYGKTG